MFTGEVNQLSGRRSLVRCQAREASTVLEISRANLRHVMQNDAALAEIFLRAFLLRRVYLIAQLGRRRRADRVQPFRRHPAAARFLTRNGHPHTYFDVERDTDMQAVLDQFEHSA